jgi:hypothetical protein
MVKISIWWGLLAVLVILVLIGCGFGAGYGYCQQRMNKYAYSLEPITVDIGLGYLQEMKASHQVYVDCPHLLPDNFGGLAFQVECVKEYDQLIDLVRRLNR